MRPQPRTSAGSSQSASAEAGLLEAQDVEEVVAELLPPASRWGGSAARGIGGTLRPATARTRSGCNSAVCQTTIAPQSWPMNTACSRADVVEQADQVAGERVDVVVLDGRRAADEPP